MLGVIYFMILSFSLSFVRKRLFLRNLLCLSHHIMGGPLQFPREVVCGIKWELLSCINGLLLLEEKKLG